jgi:hypothetical protein
MIARARRRLTANRGLGREKDLIAITKLLEQLADHHLGLAVAARGIDDLRAELREILQHLATRSDVFSRCDAVLIRPQSHYGQLLAGGRNRLGDRGQTAAGLRLGRIRRLGNRAAHCQANAGGETALNHHPTRDT